MKFNRIYLLPFITVILLTSTVYAQRDFTLYNMGIVPQSRYLNPGFIPQSKVNIGLPGISSIYADLSNSGFKYNDVIRRRSDDSLYVDVDNLAKSVARVNFLKNDLQVDLFSIGIKVKENYFGFNATEKISWRFGYPRDLLVFANELNGESFLGKRISFDGLGVDATHYREFGFSWARKLKENLSVGGRLKYVRGIANVTTKRSELGITTNEETFYLTVDGAFDLRTSGVSQFFENDTTNEEDDFDFGSYIKGQNTGLGLDIGGVYQFNEQIELSASLTDLGMIFWRNNVKSYKSQEVNFEFRGITIGNPLNPNDSTFDEGIDELADSLENMLDVEEGEDSYSTSLTTRLHLGGTYKLSEKQKVGALLTTTMENSRFRPTISLSYNFTIKKWLALSASYSAYGRSFANVGAGLSANLWPVQLYIVSDNILAPMLPHATKNVHLHTGINLTFGRKDKDKDKDGIPDKVDDCPLEKGIPLFNGCPDSDKDSIPDKDDKCPDKAGPKDLGGCPDRDGDKIIDSKDKCPDDPGLEKFEGCPDKDDDGVMDKEDECPETPGLKEFKGCPDTDGDGIEDREDECPDKMGVAEFKGCPDTDADGIEDRNDECPDDKGLEIYNGCPDSDNDSIIDKLDKCPQRAGPKENKGCPFDDRDGDTILDKDDGCPDQAGPAENNGCPYPDTDGDGVLDKDDKCIKTPGPAENNGCPVIKEEEKEILKTAFSNLEFESGKSVIKSSSFASLDELGELLKKKPEWKLKISGHTDDVGSEAINMKLSKNRSNAVAKYIQGKKAIAPSRFIVEWWGESKPIADNKTEEGRQTNRRVEMEVVFE